MNFVIASSAVKQEGGRRDEHDRSRRHVVMAHAAIIADLPGTP
jgi:hypothetical protein